MLALVWQNEYPEKVRNALPYTERMGLLLVARSNMTLAGGLMLWAMGSAVEIVPRILLALALAFNYWEAWRTWLFRVERMRIYVAGANSEGGLGRPDPL